MKCILCNERNGSTRCEGCNGLFCLPCMNKHHDDLAQQFQQLLDVRNEVNQCLNTIKSTSMEDKQIACLSEIDEWERETVRRIRQLATQVRINANEIMSNHMDEIVHRFEQLSGSMQQQEKQGDYLENDIERVKKQLNQMRDDIEHVNEKVQIDFTVSKNVEWGALIYVNERKAAKSETVKSTPQQKENEKSLSMSRSLSMTGVNKQMLEASAEPSSIPVHVMRSNSLSVRSNQRTNRSGTCTLCQRIFYNSASAYFCSNCIQRLPSSTSNQTDIFQSPTQNVSLPIRDRNIVVTLPPASVTKSPLLIYCLQCNIGNLSNDSLDNANYFCSMCRNLVYSV